MQLEQISDTIWEIPKSGMMRVPGRIIADRELLPKIQEDKAHEQVANVACLPGIVGYSFAMPDAHWGYGFPIGGVAATDPEQGGVISPGGVGYDINCGVRLVTTFLNYDDIRQNVQDLVNALYRDIPAGVGSSGAIRNVRGADLRAVLEKGAHWAVEHGFGTANDLEHTEEKGCLAGADADAVSDRAKTRGEDQLGTLGSGNHFAELGVVEQIFDERVANVFGLRIGGVVLIIHSGSRGLGYQVCDDSIHDMMRASGKYGIRLPDKQLCCAPVLSPEGHKYLAAMAAAANYAWANRQIIMSLALDAIQKTLNLSPRELGARLLYDVCHNIAKLEEHNVGGVKRRLCVHRKGATRAFPGSRPEVPVMYKSVGQPVLVPGDMGTGSYVCVGTETALETTFGSCCHGAGRLLSRTAARKTQSPNALLEDLQARGIVVMARSKKTVTEESPDAYKDVDHVANVADRAGIGKRVARIRPIGVIKG